MCKEFVIQDVHTGKQKIFYDVRNLEVPDVGTFSFHAIHDVMKDPNVKSIKFHHTGGISEIPTQSWLVHRVVY